VGWRFLIILFVCVGAAAADVTGDGSFFITRLNAGEPIITEVMFGK